MRAPVLLLSLLLAGCASYSPPQCPTLPLRDDIATKPAETVFADVGTNIHLWRQSIVASADIARADSELESDSSAATLYASAVGSFNSYIDSFIYEIQANSTTATKRNKSSINCAALNRLAADTDERVNRFSSYVGRGGTDAAADLIVLAPVLKDLAFAAIDKYREAANENRADILAQRDAHVAALKQMKLTPMLRQP